VNQGYQLRKIHDISELNQWVSYCDLCTVHYLRSVSLHYRCQGYIGTAVRDILGPLSETYWDRCQRHIGSAVRDILGPLSGVYWDRCQRHIGTAVRDILGPVSGTYWDFIFKLHLKSLFKHVSNSKT
jgi:rRNA processing protein Gar1